MLPPHDIPLLCVGGFYLYMYIVALAFFYHRKHRDLHGYDHAILLPLSMLLPTLAVTLHLLVLIETRLPCYLFYAWTFAALVSL